MCGVESGNGPALKLALQFWNELGYQKVEECERNGDYYYRTQVKGESQKLSLTESNLSQLHVAIRLRGSEANRLKALEGYKSLAGKLNFEDPKAEEIRQILFKSNEQDYAAALEKITKVERKQKENILIPEELLHKKAFKGEEDRALEFMKKVAVLPANRLDAHIVLNCGREKVREHLVKVSGDPEFFLGADPKLVKQYIARVHFPGGFDGLDSGNCEPLNEDESGSLGTLGDIFRKAGLA